MWTWLQWLGSITCHQVPARCLETPWGPAPFCARCCGLYSAVAIGLLALALTRSWRQAGLPGRLPLGLVALAALLNATDVVAAWLGRQFSDNLVRLALGQMLGLGATFALFPLLMALLRGEGTTATRVNLRLPLALTAVVLLAAYLPLTRTPTGLYLLCVLSGLGFLTVPAAFSLALGIAIAYRGPRALL